MPGDWKQKLKPLHLVRIFEELSDEEHPLCAEELCRQLSARDVQAERKSVYHDVEALRQFGLDIVSATAPTRGYFLAERSFELPEVRLLMDAVMAAGFITQKKTRELLKKLEKLVSVHQANRIRQVYIDMRNKQDNEEIYYNIDKINTAIGGRKKIAFCYVRREFGAGGDVREHVISPYAMLWVNDHYYLVGNNQKYNNLMHLRIDRMRAVNVTGERSRHFSEVSEYRDVFDVADYAGKAFNMFGGETVQIQLRCKNYLLDSMTDRFGEDARLRPSGDSHFAVTADALHSEGLIAFIMQFGADVEVIFPKTLRDELAGKAMGLYELYEVKNQR
ncbi:MAG: WYL domain-containing protein [Oscillospiraceae bacterium]|jgi:predicted DNA-binding transcriptional regulator YafY|nr:WYL domain-containing protein [Oscillospiraceae bacterium]